MRSKGMETVDADYASEKKKYTRREHLGDSQIF